MNNLLNILVAFVFALAMTILPQQARADVEFEEFDFEEDFEDFEEEEVEEMFEEEMAEMFEEEELIGGCILDTDARLGVLCDNWSTRIIGRLYTDALFINSDNATSDGAFNPRSSSAGIRSARLGVAGTFYKDWIYKFEFDFAQWNSSNDRGQVEDAFLGYKGVRDFVFRVGNMKAAYNLEQAMSSRFGLFMEDTLSTNPSAHTKPRYPGIAMSYIREKLLSATVGVHMAPYDSNGDVSGGGDDVAVYGRITYAPYMQDFWYTHVGVGGQYYNYNGKSPDSTFIGTAPFTQVNARIGNNDILYNSNFVDDDNGPAFDYDYRYIVSFDAAGGWRNYGGQAGVTRIVQEPAVGSGIDQYHFYAQANWWLTGERNNYMPEEGVFGRVVPVRRLGGGGLGAIGVAVRYHRLILDSSETNQEALAFGDDTTPFNEGGKLWGITAGLTWKPNPYVKFIAEYVYVDRDRFACGSVLGAGATPIDGDPGLNPETRARGCRGGDSPRAVQFRAQMDF